MQGEGRRNLLAALAWLVVCAGIVVMRFSGGAPVDTDIRSILPEEKSPPAVEAALREAGAAAANRVALLVTADAEDAAVDEAAASDLEDRLTRAGMFRSDTENREAMGRWVFANRNALLCEEHPDEFTPQTAEAVRTEALARVYGVGAPVTGDLLMADPFLLTLRLADCLSQGVATSLGANRTLVSGRLTQPAFSMTTQEDLDLLLSDWKAEWAPRGVKLDTSGAVFHAAHAAQSAQSEIGFIGGAGLAGVAVLFFLVFGRIHNILATAALIGAASLSGLAVTLLVFSQVHMLAMVFAAMLVGVVSDYAVHAMAASASTGWRDNNASRAHLIRPMTISMLTTVAGFAGLVLLGVDLFRQLAVFAVTGVATAWVLVLFVYLKLGFAPANVDRAGRRWAGVMNLLRRRAKGGRWIALFGAVMAAGAVGGAVNGGVLDDVRQFQPRDAELTAQDELIAGLIGATTEQIFMVSEGPTREDAREREEAAIAAAPEGVDALALSRFDPSWRTRQATALRLKQTLYDPHIDLHRSQLGLGDKPLPAPPVADLPGWLSEMETIAADGRTYLVARLSGANDWAGPNIEGVRIVNAADQYSRAFGHYRKLAFWSLMIAAAAASVFVLTVYRQVRALAIVAAPFAAMLTGIYLPAQFGLPVSFFSMAAGMVLFGVGVDYSAFAWESARHKEDWSRISILVGGATTLLSMGLMSLSAAYPVKSFGVTVSTGVICALCLSVVPFYLARLGKENAS